MTFCLSLRKNYKYLGTNEGRKGKIKVIARKEKRNGRKG